jgi:hypothetical protein
MASNDFTIKLPVKTSLFSIEKRYAWANTYKSIDLKVPPSWAPSLSNRLASNVKSSLNSLLSLHRVGRILSSEVVGENLVLVVRIYTDVKMIQDYLGGLYFSLEDKEFSLPTSFLFSPEAESMGFHWDEVYSSYILSMSVSVYF